MKERKRNQVITSEFCRSQCTTKYCIFAPAKAAWWVVGYGLLSFDDRQELQNWRDGSPEAERSSHQDEKLKTGMVGITRNI